MLLGDKECDPWMTESHGVLISDWKYRGGREDENCPFGLISYPFKTWMMDMLQYLWSKLDMIYIGTWSISADPGMNGQTDTLMI